MGSKREQLLPPRIWFSRFHEWTPVWFGDDEWGRRTLVAGIPHVASVVIGLPVRWFTVLHSDPCAFEGCPYRVLDGWGSLCPTHDPELW